MKPICVKCQLFYRPKKNGVTFIEGMPIGSNVAPGLAEPHRWRPYKLWMADLWECRGCGHALIVGAGHEPISEHYKPDFDDKVKAYGTTLQINDC